MLAGFFFGTQFIFIEYMKLCTDNTHSCSGMYNIISYTLPPSPLLSPLSPTDIDYIFGHYSGILLASTLYFIIYGLIMRNKPRVYPKVILPGLLSGIMWGIAMG